DAQGRGQVNFRRLMRMRRNPALEKRGATTNEQSAEADVETSALQREMDGSYQANIMQLQSILGNRGIQQLMAGGQVHPQTGMLQRNPEPDDAAPTATVDAPVADQPAPANDPEQAALTNAHAPQGETVMGEEFIFMGGPEFHSKALKLNQYYAK